MMNKFLFRIFFAAILVLPAAGFCVGSNVGKAKPTVTPQEQLLWDNVISLRQEADKFQRQNMPPRPGPDANEKDINNYIKAAELFNKDIYKRVIPILDASKEYYIKYPKGAFAKENLDLLLTLFNSVVYLNDGIMRPEDQTVYNRLCTDENLTAEQAGVLFWINLTGLHGLIETPKDVNQPDKKAIELLIDKMEAQINNFGPRFKLQGSLLGGQLEMADAIEKLYPQRSKEILELTRKYATDEDKKKVDGIIRNKNILGTKSVIKFKTIDGNEVDLSKMKGKVVLIDFWATWCQPCMIELPNVLNVYKKYHGKGFEIIGISFDSDYESVKKVTKEMGMTWPQYFDGKFWGNELGIYFGIRAIPTMWLVDKDGKVIDTDPRGPQLANKVAKLLGIAE